MTSGTWPIGDIVLEYGQSLQIFCILNKTYVDASFPGKNASDLVFFRNNKRMEPEFITIVNETTISLNVDKPPPAEDMYYCKLKLTNGDYEKHLDDYNNNDKKETTVDHSKRPKDASGEDHGKKDSGKEFEAVCLNKVVIGCEYTLRIILYIILFL